MILSLCVMGRELQGQGGKPASDGFQLLFVIIGGAVVLVYLMLDRSVRCAGDIRFEDLRGNRGI